MSHELRELGVFAASSLRPVLEFRLAGLSPATAAKRPPLRVSIQLAERS